MRFFLRLVIAVMAMGSFGSARGQSVEQASTTPELERRDPLSGPALDRAIDRIIAREHYLYAILPYFHPTVETRIEDDRKHGEEEVPWRHWYFQGRADIWADLRVHSTLQKNPDTGYRQVGFLQEAFIDRTGFDRQHYAFHYVGEDSIEGTRCLVFDVTPLSWDMAGRFHGRIWANDQDYTIIHFTGTYFPLIHWELVPTPTRTKIVTPHFDSWRSSIEPGVWVPSAISSQESGLREGRQTWDFSAETQFSAYNVTRIQDPAFPAYTQHAFQKTVPLHYQLGKEFWIPWAVNFGLMMTANALTARCLNAPHPCVEEDPILGRHPPAAAMFSVRIAAFTTGFALARRAKLRGDSTYWHYATYLPMFFYAWDALHDVVGTLQH